MGKKDFPIFFSCYNYGYVYALWALYYYELPVLNFLKKFCIKMTNMTYTDVPKWPGKISRIQGPGKNLEIFFEDRALKIVFLEFSLNSKAISFKTLFCWTNISKKCQLISAVCLLFFKKFVDPILNQQFLKNFKWVSWI